VTLRASGGFGGVADPDCLPRVLGVARADVDVHVLDLDRLPLLALLPRQPRRGDHARDTPVAREDLDALAEQHLWVPAAEPAEREVAELVGVRDRETDLVQVAEEREQRPFAGARDARHGVPDGVAGDLRERTRRLAPDRGGGGLRAGRAWRLEEFPQQFGDSQGAPAY